MIYRKIKKILAFFIICMLLITGISFGNNSLCTDDVYAATPKTIFDSVKTMSSTVNIDLTGDGKKEKVKFRATENRYTSIATFRINVNGKNALTLKSLGYSVKVNYLKLSTNNIYLYIVDCYENDDPTIDAIYRYNQNTQKLDRILTLETVNCNKGVCHIYSTVKTSKNTLKVTYMGQMDATGYITWVYDYKLKNGKFVLKNTTAKVISKWHKGKFVVNKKITFYKKAGSTKKAFTIKPGTAVKLQKMKLLNKTYYLQFKYGKKIGWIKAGQFDIFKNVMLAG